MFDQLVESTSARRGLRTWFYFAWSSLVWSIVLTTVAVAGVMTYDARLDADFERFNRTLVAQTPLAPPPPRATQPTPRDTTPTPDASFRAQSVQPTTIAPPSPRPPSIGTNGPGTIDAGSGRGFPGGEPGNPSPDGIPDGAPRTDIARTSPPPPPPPPAVEQPQPPPARRAPVSMPITGRAIRRVEPKYPAIAAQTNVQGSVNVEVTVSETGKVLSVRSVSGHPLLRGAAESAARQWTFSPTTLNGVPVKVVGTITFVFEKH
jgi:protein TonB